MTGRLQFPISFCMLAADFLLYVTPLSATHLLAFLCSNRTEVLCDDYDCRPATIKVAG